MSTGVCGPDGIPILKRLTALEPELTILSPCRTAEQLSVLSPLKHPITRQVATGSSENLVARLAEELRNGKAAVEVEEDEGYVADEDVSTEHVAAEEPALPDVSLNTPVGAHVEMPVWIWLSVAVVGIAWLWGVVYALSPTRTSYPPY